MKEVLFYIFVQKYWFMIDSISGYLRKGGSILEPGQKGVGNASGGGWVPDPDRKYE